MNILYHHRTQGKGVEGVHIREMAKAFTALGNEVDIVSPAGLENSSLSTTSESNSTHKFISKFTPELIFELIEVFYNFVVGKKLNDLLNKKKYDFIYERYAIFNWAGVMATKKFRIPLILEVNYTSFTPLYRKRSWALKSLAHWLDKKIFSATDGIVVVSNMLKEHLIGLGVAPDKIIVCTNAADPEKFNPEVSGKEIRDKFNLNGRKVIGFVGGFYPWHGLDILIDAFAKLKDEVREADLLLIGDGPEKKTIQKKIEDLYLSNSVKFADKVSHEDLPKYIAAFDIAVMPDSNDYGSPMKIYEYMAMGKPVVAPRLGPLEDGIEHGKEGVLFKQHDRASLIEALKKLLLDDNLRKKMGDLARENILSKHAWQKNAEVIIEFYNRIKTLKKIE